MLACLCNYCCSFCSSHATPNFEWRHFTACLLDNPFTNKIDRFKYYDGDRETKLEIYLYDYVLPGSGSDKVFLVGCCDSSVSDAGGRPRLRPVRRGADPEASPENLK